MIIAAVEGSGWHYEVVADDECYSVRLRDRHTGKLDKDVATSFRTVPVALAYARALAALDRYVGVEERDPSEREALLNEAVLLEHAFKRVRELLRDDPDMGTELDGAVELSPTLH